MTHLSDDTLQELPAIVGLDPADVTRWSIDPSETQRTSQFQVVPSPAASSLAALDGSTVRRQMNRALLSERAGKGLLIPRNNSFSETGVLSADVTDAESSSDVLPDEGSGAEAYDVEASNSDPSETAATHQYLRAIRHRDAERLLSNMPEDRPTAPRFADASEWVASEELLPSSPSLSSAGCVAAFSSGSLSSIDVDSSELWPKSSEPAFRLDSLADVDLVDVDVEGAVDTSDEAVRSDELYAFENEAYTTDLASLPAREHLTADVPFPRTREDLTMDLPFRRTMESPTASFASSSTLRTPAGSPASVWTAAQRSVTSSSRIPVSRVPSSSRITAHQTTRRSTSSFPPVTTSDASDEQWMALMPPPVFVEHAVTDLDLMIKDSTTGSGPQSAHPTSPIIRRTPFHRSRFMSPGVGWGVVGIGLGVVLGALWVGFRSSESASGSLGVPSVAAQPNTLVIAAPSVVRTPVATWASPKASVPQAPVVTPLPAKAAAVVPSAPVAAPVLTAAPLVAAPVPVVAPVVPAAVPVVPAAAPVVVAPVVSVVAPAVAAPVVSVPVPASPVAAPVPGEFSIDSLPLEPESVLVQRKHKR